MAGRRKSRSHRRSKSRSHSRSHRRSKSHSRSCKSHSPSKNLKAYCVTCRSPHVMENAKMRRTKNHRNQLVGVCKHNGNKMFRFV